jgi:hypothetical protein
MNDEEDIRPIDALSSRDIQMVLKLMRKELLAATREPGFYGEVAAAVKLQEARIWHVAVGKTQAFQPNKTSGKRAA